MKIGILSMQKILNYGSFLQAFSLKKQFENRGHDVYFIDVEIGREICQEQVERRNLIGKIDKYFFKRIENCLLSRKMKRIHINDYEMYLETEKKISEGECFDIVVIGSDEVFNATTPSPWGFTKQLFGAVYNANTVVTYAASCGSTTLLTAQRYGICNEISSALKNVKYLSVRDENTFDFIKGLTGRDGEMNVDPVFLANYDSYIPLPKKRSPYMLVYAYSNRINDEREIRAIKQYAKKNGLEIICVGMQQRWCSKNIAANAFELIGYVKDATCVVTDTFHGTVFSIKYNKRFVSLVRESNVNKLGWLLKQFDLYDRAIFDVENFEKVLDTNINFDKVNELILVEQDKAKKYLDAICDIG